MAISCMLGFHDWNGCKCYRCGKTRNEGHDWNNDCEKCSKCHATRKNAHKWVKHRGRSFLFDLIIVTCYKYAMQYTVAAWEVQAGCKSTGTFCLPGKGRER